MPFKKAVKYGGKLRLALAGPAGGGKTYTALTLATTIANGEPIALIDTERGSASKYADLFTFDVDELDTFHPDKFIQSIKAAEQAGYKVLIIDSLSHAWNGPGGLLEMVEKLRVASTSKNAFTEGWSKATPLQNKLIDAIVSSPLHIIVTMRSKSEYVMEMGSNGKNTPRKVGTTPIQRDGLEYEFDIYADMDVSNTMIVQKSRCPELSGAVIEKPGEELAQTLLRWLDGIPAPVPVPTLSESYKVGLEKGSWKKEEFYTAVATLLSLPIVTRDTQLTDEQLKRVAEEAAKGNPLLV